MCVRTCARARRCPVSDGSIDMQDRDNRLLHSSRRSDVARFEYGQRGSSIVHDAYEASALQIRLCHIPSLLPLHPLYLSSSLSITRPFARVNDSAPTRFTVRSISSSFCSSSSPLPLCSRPISKIAFSSRPSFAIRHEPLNTPAIQRRRNISE